MLLCKIVVNNTAQNSSDNLSHYPPDSQYCSGVSTGGSIESILVSHVTPQMRTGSHLRSTYTDKARETRSEEGIGMPTS